PGQGLLVWPTERSYFDGASRLVGSHDDAAAGGLALGLPQPGGDRPFAKQAFSLAQGDRGNHDEKAIDQPRRDQRLQQSRAAVNLQLGAVLLLEPLDLRNDTAPVAPDDLRRAPLGTIERTADHVFGRLIERSREFVVALGPVRRENLVR